jgi:hypothetical protein
MFKDRKNVLYWSPDKMNDSELKHLLYSLKRSGEDGKTLYDKIWCWKLNYRKND